MQRVCPRHRVPLLELGDELRCPAAPHEVRGWLVVDDRGAIWAAATRRRVCLPPEGFGLEWPVVMWELAQTSGRYPPAP